MTDRVFEVRDLSHFFAGKSVLSQLSFDIDAGERVVLLGANGCGKSTLLRILNGLIAPSSGEVRYQGQAISPALLKKTPALQRQFRQSVCLLFQHPEMMIFNPTVYDEIAFGVQQIEGIDVDARVTYWANQVGVGHLLTRLPFNLSGGEKQKVCLAAMLALEPRVLLLDEPTSAMDPRSTGWLIDFLNALGITTLISTHNLSLAVELGARALVLSEDHRLIYDGDIAPLFEDLSILLSANLVHTHQHRHGGAVHSHLHIHDWG